MVNSLVAGLSGLRVHQQLIDVVGNNLANANTPGYKGSRATFAEILTSLLRQGTAPTSSLGGTNPIQLGLGVKLATVDLNMNQGSFATTGRTFDLGIQGNGFFVVNDGEQNFYTRSGTFGLDSNSDLIDLKNGFKVQSITGESINIDTTGLFPPNQTTEINMKGNLPAKVEGPKAQTLVSDTPYLEGTEASVASATGPFDFSASGSETMTLSVNGSSPITVTFADSAFATPATATAAEVKTVIDAALVTAGLDDELTVTVASGAFTLTTVDTGATAASIKVTNTGGAASILGLSTTQAFGDEDAATESTALNDIVGNSTNYVDGDQINVVGKNFDGSTINATFTYGSGDDGTTLGDLRDFIDGLYTGGADCTIDDSGNLVLTANETGETSLSLVVSDATGNTGATSFGSHAEGVSVRGVGPDTVITSIPVFDSSGLGHNLTLTFTRVNGSEWDLVGSIPTAEGEMTVASIDGIQFEIDGSFKQVIGESSLTIQFTGDPPPPPQTINFSLGSSGEFDGLTQFGEEKTAQASGQDGYGPGTLSTISIRQDGVIQGVYTNGQVQDLGSLAIATFKNPAGLTRGADTLFALSTNSGPATLSAGTQGSAGTVVGGILENSNVDVAEEFVKLVEAQRGFQAAAKVIQTTDQMLGDLNQII